MDAPVLVICAAPALGWKVGQAVSASGRTVLFGSKPGFPGRHQLPFCERYVELQSLRWSGQDRIDPVVLEEIDRVRRKEGVQLVVPGDLATTVLLAESAGKHRFPLPEPETLHRVHDKWSFSQLLLHLGLPQPPTRLLCEVDGDPTMEFPVLTKPRELSNSVGIATHKTPGALSDWTHRQTAVARRGAIVQERVPGDDVTVTLLADHGKVVASACCQHHERKWRRRFFHDDHLLDMVARIVENTAYHGIGGIDLRLRDGGHDYRILEFNPRFAGSLLYCVAAGINFADLAIRMAQGETLPPTSVHDVGWISLPTRERLTGLYMTAVVRARRHLGLFATS